jgi:WD40 repeat protein/DNA-binding XRE family transcriptional regulator
MNEEMSFGRIVKEHRRALDLTQAELARRVACATITVRKIEADALRPSQQIAERMAMSLNVPLEERATFVRLARLAMRETPEPSPLPTPPPTSDEIGQEDLSGRAIRGYELGERIGTGGFGVVYRAVQPLIEREVAVKIVLPQYADHPDFIRRFEAEARLVARLEHPYIVPLYDYWREPGVAYLVMRLLRGGSLHAMLKEGPLELETVAVLLEQVGAALHAAHRVGVIHRDLKPANVLLDEDGNGYLADFGIAKNLSDPDLEDLTQADSIVGSPAYSSPEQIRSEPVKPQADIYCLGVLVYELLAGRQPFQGPTPIDYMMQHLNQPLPPLEAHPVLDPVIQRATAKDPLDRYPDVPGLLADFRQAVTGDRSVAVAVDAVPHRVAVTDEELENPYKGLRPFGEADADDFFGRETLVQELLGSMGEVGEPAAGARQDLARFLAVVGPSGSGKSSLVKAGLIPALREGGLPNSENWFIVDLMPGAHPLEELEAALLRVAVNPPESLLAQLREDERGLLRAVRRVLPSDPSTELVLVIDQFEEVFTQASARGSARGVADEEIRAFLLDSLVTAVLDKRSRVRVVVTLRADFTGRALEYVDFGELVRQRTAFVLPLTPDELEQAIVGPATRAGLAVEPGLVATVVQDVGDQPGILPLLQYALTELFERREGRTLTLAAYRESGGVTGALSRRAEELYAGLDEAGQEAARQLFLRLITLGEGASDAPASPDTRRRVLRAELSALQTSEVSETSEVLDDVIDLYGHYRLLTFDHDPATRGPTVEVAHEALLREWPRLRGWLESSRADVQMERLLAAATAEWEGAGRETSYLLRGARLAQFEGWAEGSGVALTVDERAYLAASVAEREAREAEEAVRQQRELETAQKLAETERQRAEEQTRFATRVRQWAVYLAVALVVAVIAAVVALNTSNRNATLAVQNADIAGTAQAERAAAEMAQAQEAAQRATAQAAQAEEAAQRVVAETAQAQESAQRAAAEAARIEADEQREEALRQASVGLASQAVLELQGSSPERATLLALEALEDYPYTSQAERALSQAVLSNRLDLVLRHEGEVYEAYWSPDEARILTASKDGTAKVWDAHTGEELLTLPVSKGPLPAAPTSPELGASMFAALSASWSPSGERIATASIDGTGTARIWDASPSSPTYGQELLTLSGHEGCVSAATWSPTGEYIATADCGGNAWVWDTTSGERLADLIGHAEGATFIVRWSPEGARILTAGEDGTARVWDPVTGEELLTLSGHTALVWSAEWSPGGERFVTASEDTTAKVWDATTGDLLFTLTGHKRDVMSAVWSPAGDRIATGSADSAAKVWDATTGEELVALAGSVNTVQCVMWSPAGDRILTTNPGTAKVWDAETGTELVAFAGHKADVDQGMWSKDGSRILTGGGDGTARVWHVSGPELLTLSVFQGVGTVSAAWSPAGDRIVTANLEDEVVKVWDAATGENLYTVEHTHGFCVGAWSPASDHLVVTCQDGAAMVWETATGEELLTLAGHKEWTTGMWSLSGEQVVTASDDTTAKVWDATTGELLLTFSGHEDMVLGAAWSPAGDRIVTTSADGVAKVWEAATGDELLSLHIADNWLTAVAWSADGTRIATYSDDGLGQVWDAVTGEILVTLFGHSGSVWAIRWSPAGDRLLTISQDGTARVWDATAGAELAHYTGGFIWDGDWSPDGTRIVVGDSDGTAKVFPAWQTTQELIDIARECCVFGELTDAERELFGLPVR